MITELLQLYERVKHDVCVEVPFAWRRIHWIIDLSEGGEVIGVSPAISRNHDGKGKVKESLGKEYHCPASFFLKLKEEKIAGGKPTKIPKRREVIAASGGGSIPPELMSGKAGQIFGEEPDIKKDKNGNVTEKNSKGVTANQKNNHDAFVSLHKRYLDSLDQSRMSAELCAMKRFLQSEPTLPLDSFSDKDVAQFTKDQRLSFRVNGRLLFQLPEVKQWWHEDVAKQRSEIRAWLPIGMNIFSAEERTSPIPLAVRFPHIQGVPNGGGYCPIASFDKAPMQSYGLGEITAPLGLDPAERASSALNWLLHDNASHVRMGDAVVIFWAIDETADGASLQSLGFGELMKEADPLQVREFLKGAWGVHPNVLDTSRFYAAVLSSPQSRITIRSWHTETLPNAVAYFRRWLELSLLPNRYGDDCPTSITDFADCTVRKSKNSKPLPRTYSELFEAALFGRPLPSRLYSAALKRQSLELAKGCDKKTRTEFEDRLRTRTALIKLYLSKKGVTINMNNHTEQNDSAYLCGRLLAMLDKIHIEAHKNSGGTNSSPANRSYSAASTTPALAFPQLCKLARYHLNKIGKGWANCLEHGYKNKDTGEVMFEGLKHICAHLKEAAGCNFPRTLSLEEQGRFAIGFYYERCRQWPKKDNANDTAENTKSEPDTQE